MNGGTHRAAQTGLHGGPRLGARRILLCPIGHRLPRLISVKNSLNAVDAAAKRSTRRDTGSVAWTSMVAARHLHRGTGRMHNTARQGLRESPACQDSMRPACRSLGIDGCTTSWYHTPRRVLLRNEGKWGPPHEVDGSFEVSDPRSSPQRRRCPRFRGLSTTVYSALPTAYGDVPLLSGRGIAGGLSSKGLEVGLGRPL